MLPTALDRAGGPAGTHPPAKPPSFRGAASSAPQAADAPQPLGRRALTTYPRTSPSARWPTAEACASQPA